jgi:hypothetical protein
MVYLGLCNASMEFLIFYGVARLMYLLTCIGNGNKSFLQVQVIFSKSKSCHKSMLVVASQVASHKNSDSSPSQMTRVYNSVNTSKEC